MPKVLVVYDSVSGAAAEIAVAVADSLSKRGHTATAKSVDTVTGSSGPENYDAVVAGAPARLGRPTKKMKRFLATNLKALSERPFALFFTCLSIPTENGLPAPPLPVFIDPSLSGVNRAPGWLNFYEYFHTPYYTVKKFIRRHPGLKPESTAFLNGRLDFKKLSPPLKAFMFAEMIFLEDIREGDFVDLKTARKWASGLFQNTL